MSQTETTFKVGETYYTDCGENSLTVEAIDTCFIYGALAKYPNPLFPQITPQTHAYEINRGDGAEWVETCGLTITLYA